jgi:hypothetical protein
MVQIYMVLALVINQVLLSRVPVKCIHFLCNFVPNPEKLHLHRSRTLSLDGIVCHLHLRGILTIYGGFRLQMAHIGKHEAKYNSCLAIVVQCAQFRFGGGCNDKFDIVVLTWNAPFNRMGAPSIGIQPMKK